MGRYYKIILSFIVAVFMGTSTISAYEGNGLDFIRITSLLKQIQNKDNEVLNLYDLKNKKDENIISCVRNVETSVNDIENTNKMWLKKKPKQSCV